LLEERDIVNTKLKAQGQKEALSLVDKNGNIAMPFNTALMFRGTINSNGKIEVLIY